MNNVDDGSGTKETRLKVIRSEGIGSFSWDTSSSRVNNELGINEWSQSKIMKLLNPGYEKESVGGSLYWNNQSGTCYNNRKNGTTACDFTSSGLSLDTKRIIGKTLWQMGSNGTEASANNIKTTKFYEFERSSNTGKICTSGDYCNDTVERTVTWEGYIGLMSPSDYGYATSGGVTTNRDACLTQTLGSWRNLSDCKTNDWLYNSSTGCWTLMPVADSSYPSYVFLVSSSGHVDDCYSYNSELILPVVYLLPNIKITNGDGSIDDMFTITKEE